MTTDQSRQSLNPSIWEWRTAYTDLQRVGIKKPTSGQIAEVIQAREGKILDPQAAISGTLTQRDVSNLEMRVAFSPAQPVAINRNATNNKPALSQKSLQPATLLPIGKGGSNEY